MRRVARWRRYRHDGEMLPAELIETIDHVGIAVPDLDEALDFYRERFGFEIVHEEVNESQGVREAMIGSDRPDRSSNSWRR